MKQLKRYSERGDGTILPDEKGGWCRSFDVTVLEIELASKARMLEATEDELKRRLAELGGMPSPRQKDQHAHESEDAKAENEIVSIWKNPDVVWEEAKKELSKLRQDKRDGKPEDRGEGRKTLSGAIEYYTLIVEIYANRNKSRGYDHSKE